MRITLDCERMRYAHTGLFEYCHQLGTALKAEKDPEDELRFYLKPGLEKQFESTDSFLKQDGLHKFIFPRIKNTDLWHTTYQLSSYVPRSKKIKRVLTIHDLNFLHEHKSPAKVKSYLQKLQKNINLSDQIVAISSFTKQDIENNLKIDNKPIEVIYNGCAIPPDFSEITPTNEPSLPFLFALGTVNPKKNFHVLVPLLTDNDFELIIAGKTESAYQEKIMQEAAKHNLSNRVKVIGPITDQEKTWYYKNCEAFLFPSIAEGFGIPPIEAMRFGKPTFLSDSTSLPEIGGSVAYYFHNFDPEEMRKVFNKGMEHYHQHQPAKKIIDHAAQFQWGKSAKAYLDVYKKVLNA